MDTQLKLAFMDDDILYAASPKLVAFAGRAGSGKSVAAGVLMDAGYKRVKFADGLKGMLSSLYTTAGLSTDDIHRRLEGDLKETPDPILQWSSPRRAMQLLGNEWGRELIHPEIWVHIWSNAVMTAFSQGYNVVVDDIRYENEANAVRSLHGSVVHIQRENTTVAVSDHPSEQFDFEMDFKVSNAGTEENFIEVVRELFL
jgi:hypothetical protein